MLKHHHDPLRRINHTTIIPNPRSRQPQQLPKIRRPQPRHRIPPHTRVPARSRKNRTPIQPIKEIRIPITPLTPPLHHIIQSPPAHAIQPRIQEPQRRQPIINPRRIQQRDNRIKRWRSAGSPLVTGILPLIHNPEIQCLGCDVGKSSAARIIPAFILTSYLSQIFIDGEFLVCWSRPDFREAARGEIDGLFGLDEGCASYSSYQGQVAGKLGWNFVLLYPSFERQ
jgi:hypothetical protein